MEFYIYKNSSWQQVYVEVEPKLALAFDTTNDSFSCVLQAEDNDKPYAPMTPFKIIDDSNNTTIMWIINDAVSVFSLKPLLYKHELSIVQYRYFLNKHLIRNTIFNQPRKKIYKLYGAATNYQEFIDTGKMQFQAISSSGNTVMWTDSLPLGAKSKVKGISYTIKLYGTTIINSDVSTNAISSLVPEDFIQIKSTAKFYVYDANYLNTVVIDNLYISQFNTINKLTKSQIDTVNNYLAVHNSALLKVGIRGSAVETDDWERAFAEITNVEFLNATYKNITAQLHMNLELYNYTMYDVIDTLLKQYRLSYGLYQNKRQQLFYLPASGELYDLLKSTYPPDTMTFTQSTWYDALSEIFRFYDAGFKFNENAVLDIEYYNDYKANKNPDKTGLSLNYNDKNYENSRIAYYQNAVAPIELKKMPIRTQEFGVPGQSDYGILLPYPIYDVTKLEYVCKCNGTMPFTPSVAEDNQYNFKSTIGLDLTYFLLNEQEWTVLPKTSGVSGSIYDFKQLTTFYFTRGSNFIKTSDYNKNWDVTSNPRIQDVIRGSVARFFGFNEFSGTHGFQTPSTTPAATTYQNQFFNIEYLTENNGRLITENVKNKYLGEFLNNQSSGGVDLNKLGLNMFGESLKDGEPTLSCSFTMTNWTDRIVEGDYINYQGDRWVANVVNYTPVKDGVYQCSVQFVKNFNTLSARIKTDKEKRLSNVSRELATMSEDNFIDYIYVSDSGKGPDRNATVLSNSVLESMVGQTFGISADAYTIKNVDFSLITTTTTNGGSIASNLFIPIIKYGAGNCVCFEMQYNDPLNAGNQMITGTGWFWQDTRFTQACLYTDREGWADRFTIEFIDPTNEYYDYTPSTIKFPQLQKTVSGTTLLNVVGTLNNLNYYKKTNEIFALNYEWCFLPLPTEIHDFFIGSAFINNNFFVNKEIAKTKKFYLYYTYASDNHQYSILDTKGVMRSGATRKELTFMTKKGSNYVALYLMCSYVYASGSWAVCDEDGNIYFASNNGGRFDDNVDDTDTIIYFMTKTTRMNDGDTISNLPSPYAPSGTYSLVVRPNEWVEIPQVWSQTIDYSGSPTAYNIDGSATYTWQSGTFDRVPAGTTTSPKNMESGYPVIQGRDGCEGVSVTYTVTTSGIQRYFEFTAVIQRPNYQHGDSFNATIYYAFSGVSARYYKEFVITIPELVGVSLSSYSISPASAVIDGITMNNEIAYNSSTGTFTGRVWKPTNPTTDTTYTITYVAN